MTQDPKPKTASGSLRIGVLALQGDFDAHRRRLEELGAKVVLVKKPEQLDAIDGLVIPGGESGTFLKLLGEEGFAKLKTLLRKAEERTVDGLWRRIGGLLDTFTPGECANYLQNAGYASI